MDPMDPELARIVLIVIGGSLFVSLAAWATIDQVSRAAYWVRRILVWVIGSITGFIIAWAIYSLIV